MLTAFVATVASAQVARLTAASGAVRVQIGGQELRLQNDRRYPNVRIGQDLELAEIIGYSDNSDQLRLMKGSKVIDSLDFARLFNSWLRSDRGWENHAAVNSLRYWKNRNWVTPLIEEAKWLSDGTMIGLVRYQTVGFATQVTRRGDLVRIRFKPLRLEHVAAIGEPSEIEPLSYPGLLRLAGALYVTRDRFISRVEPGGKLRRVATLPGDPIGAAMNRWLILRDAQQKLWSKDFRSQRLLYLGDYVSNPIIDDQSPYILVGLRAIRVDNGRQVELPERATPIGEYAVASVKSAPATWTIRVYSLRSGRLMQAATKRELP